VLRVNSLAFLVVTVFFGATLVRSALGFGEALIAVPMLAFVLPVEVSTLLGIPLGLLLLRTVPEPIVKGVLGVLVAGFAAPPISRRCAEIVPWQLRHRTEVMIFAESRPCLILCSAAVKRSRRSPPRPRCR